jgi:hypothetical protein
MISCLWLAFLHLQILDKLGYAVTGGFREVEELGMSCFRGSGDGWMPTAAIAIRLYPLLKGLSGIIDAWVQE